MLGVREWTFREGISGGLDSYTKVSSVSDESASPTAEATLASKISAFEEAALPRNDVSPKFQEREELIGGLGIEKELRLLDSVSEGLSSATGLKRSSSTCVDDDHVDPYSEYARNSGEGKSVEIGRRECRE